MKFAAVTAASAAVMAALPAAADPVADFYKGKQMTVYVGLSAGGGYDTNARLVARYIGQHIPGKPTVIVRNMPGGGGIVMTNFVANVAPKDGLHMGAPQRGVPFEPLFTSNSHAKFEPLKLNWIGSTNSDTSLAVVNTGKGIKSWEDLRKREIVVAGTGVGTESVVIPYVLRNLMGFKYKVIAGYPGGSQMNLAMLRGEVDGRGTFSWTSLKPHYKEWIESGKLAMIYQQGLKKHPELKNVPLVQDLTDNPETKKILRLQFTAFEMGRPLFVAGGVPADRVAALRKAFDATMKDPGLLADAKRQKQDIDPMTGAEMSKLLQEAFATPKELVEKLRAAGEAKPDLKVRPKQPKDKKK
ncbi:MAG: Bug family tripartite tricarboxylate transporter substrate binding protein [Beijerinckiaceae bacterium]